MGLIWGNPLVQSQRAYIHPYVVIQNNVLNRYQIRTVIVCALTTNLRRAKALVKQQF
jgi:mRNA interferase MazF